MSEHDHDRIHADIKRAFALAEDPAPGGFTVQVAARVAVRERRNRFGAGVRIAGMAVAGAAGGYGLLAVAGAIMPQVQAAFGIGLLDVLTAQTPIMSVGAPLMMLMGAAAGAVVALAERDYTDA